MTTRRLSKVPAIRISVQRGRLMLSDKLCAKRPSLFDELRACPEFIEGTNG